mmetsp:Transcript_2000/g.4649  ORF Transcript_2000/g.4649 Transcript_2000/m.4649 type:complete len:82 (-) Transcript_2000:388-633(-)
MYKLQILSESIFLDQQYKLRMIYAFCRYWRTPFVGAGFRMRDFSVFLFHFSDPAGKFHRVSTWLGCQLLMPPPWRQGSFEP